MKTKEIQNISMAINSVEHFLEFSQYSMKIVYGIYEIGTSDNTMMEEIKEVFARQKSRLEKQLAALITNE